MKPLRINLRGKRYTVRHCKLPRSVDGEFDADAKVLAVNERLTHRAHLDTVVHETLHACLPDAAEEAINETACDIARLLWRLGYRRCEV